MSDTPRTDAAIQQMFMTTGHVGPHNCPEWLVGHSRQLERELAEVTEQRDRLAEAGQAVVDRWHTPIWKDVPHTAKFIQNLEAALATVKGGSDE